MNKCKNCGHKIILFLEGMWFHKWIETDRHSTFERSGKRCESRMPNGCGCKNPEPLNTSDKGDEK